MFNSILPLAGPFPKLNDKSPVDAGPAEPGAVKQTMRSSELQKPSCQVDCYLLFPITFQIQVVKHERIK